MKWAETVPNFKFLMLQEHLIDSNKKKCNIFWLLKSNLKLPFRLLIVFFTKNFTKIEYFFLYD